MCGFAGYIHNYGTFDKEEVIHKMADRIKHRGPDDAHYYIDDGIALGFRRLSIIDLEGGRQPILNEDGSLVLLFNGEIYQLSGASRRTYQSRTRLHHKDRQRNDFARIRGIRQKDS